MNLAKDGAFTLPITGDKDFDKKMAELWAYIQTVAGEFNASLIEQLIEEFMACKLSAYYDKNPDYRICLEVQK